MVRDIASAIAQPCGAIYAASAGPDPGRPAACPPIAVCSTATNTSAPSMRRCLDDARDCLERAVERRSGTFAAGYSMLAEIILAGASAPPRRAAGRSVRAGPRPRRCTPGLRIAAGQRRAHQALMDDLLPARRSRDGAGRGCQGGGAQSLQSQHHGDLRRALIALRRDRKRRTLSQGVERRPRSCGRPGRSSTCSLPRTWRTIARAPTITPSRSRWRISCRA